MPDYNSAKWAAAAQELLASTKGEQLQSIVAEQIERKNLAGELTATEVLSHALSEGARLVTEPMEEINDIETWLRTAAFAIIHATARELGRISSVETRESVESIDKTETAHPSADHPSKASIKQITGTAFELQGALQLPNYEFLKSYMDEFYLLSSNAPVSLELAIDIPDDFPPEKARELVQQAALAADAVHRANGGSGLTIDTVEIFEGSRVPEGSRQ